MLAYDMTLVNIDLEMEKLTRQQLEVKKKGLEQELEKLKKDKAQAVSHTEDYQVEFLGRIQKTDPAAEFTEQIRIRSCQPEKMGQKKFRQNRKIPFRKRHLEKQTRGILQNPGIPQEQGNF